MENQENPILKLRQPLSIFGVIKQTMNSLVRNRKTLQVILCLVILTNLQFHATRFFPEPISEGFSILISYKPLSKSETTCKNHTRASNEQLIITKFHIIFTSCLSLFCAIIIISSSNESYGGNNLNIMVALFKPSKNWRRPLLTSSCILLITLGIYAAYMFSFMVISFLAGRSHVINSLSLLFFTPLNWIFNAHVSALWMMSLVVTVLEENISGFKAINRAWDLMKGKRIQTSLLMIVYHVACLLVGITVDAFSWISEEKWVLKIAFVTGFDIILLVFYTVFYHECKMDNKADGILLSDTVSDKSS